MTMKMFTLAAMVAMQLYMPVCSNASQTGQNSDHVEHRLIRQVPTVAHTRRRLPGVFTRAVTCVGLLAAYLSSAVAHTTQQQEIDTDLTDDVVPVSQHPHEDGVTVACSAPDVWIAGQDMYGECGFRVRPLVVVPARDPNKELPTMTERGDDLIQQADEILMKINKLKKKLDNSRGNKEKTERQFQKAKEEFNKYYEDHINSLAELSKLSEQCHNMNKKKKEQHDLLVHDYYIIWDFMRHSVHYQNPKDPKEFVLHTIPALRTMFTEMRR